MAHKTRRMMVQLNSTARADALTRLCKISINCSVRNGDFAKTQKY